MDAALYAETAAHPPQNTKFLVESGNVPFHLGVPRDGGVNVHSEVASRRDRRQLSPPDRGKPLGNPEIKIIIIIRPHDTIQFSSRF